MSETTETAVAIATRAPQAMIELVRGHMFPGATAAHIEQFALLCHVHRLNPLLREVYAMRARDGRLNAVVGVDGWARLARSNPACRGWSFTEQRDDAGALVATTCTMHIAGWEAPLVVTERLAECQQPTDPWRRSPARMLRHKALIQAARYAFGLGGLADEDEQRAIDSDDAVADPVGDPVGDLNHSLGLTGPPAPAAPPALAAPITAASRGETQEGGAHSAVPPEAAADDETIACEIEALSAMHAIAWTRSQARASAARSASALGITQQRALELQLQRLRTRVGASASLTRPASTATV